MDFAQFCLMLAGMELGMEWKVLLAADFAKIFCS